MLPSVWVRGTEIQNPKRALIGNQKEKRLDRGHSKFLLWDHHLLHLLTVISSQRNTENEGQRQCLSLSLFWPRVAVWASLSGWHPGFSSPGNWPPLTGNGKIFPIFHCFFCPLLQELSKFYFSCSVCFKWWLFPLRSRDTSLHPWTQPAARYYFLLLELTLLTTPLDPYSADAQQVHLCVGLPQLMILWEFLTLG